MAKKPNNSPEITARKRAEGKSLGGRPPFVIDYEKLEKLCAIFCTGEECASILGCSYEILNLRLKQDYLEAKEQLEKDRKEGEEELEPENRYNGFRACFEKNSATGKASLRREQFKMAMGAFNKKGDVVMKPDKGMLIWLGKNHLDQTDRYDHTTRGDKMPSPTTTLDMTQLSDKEFDKLGELLEKAKEQKTPVDKQLH